MHFLQLLATASLATAWPSLLRRDGSSCDYTDQFSIQVNGTFVSSGSDGQLYLQSGTCSTFQLSSSGALTLTSMSNYKCYIASESSQLQCSASPASSAGSQGPFCVSNNMLTYNGSSTFYTCEGNKVYTSSQSASGCQKITLPVQGANCQVMSSSSAAKASTVVSTVVSTVSATCVPSTKVSTVVSTMQASPVTQVKTVVSTMQASPVTQTKTVMSTVQAAPVTQTKTEVSTMQASPVTQTKTVVSTMQASPVTQTKTVVSTMQAAPVTKTQTVQGSPVTQTKTVVSTMQAAPVTSTVVSTQQAPAVTKTQTVVSTMQAAPVTSTVVSTMQAPAVTKTATVVSTMQAAPVTKTATVTAQCSTVTKVVSVTEQAKTVTVSPAASAAKASTCVATSTAFPTYIVPSESGKPSGTSYYCSVGNGNSTYVTYELPKSGTCQLELLLPPANQLQTSSYTMTGNSVAMSACMCNSAVTGSTSSAPGTGQCYSATATSGQGTVVIGQFPCGGQQSFLLSATQGGLTLFEDYNPPALGFVVTQC